MHWIGISYQFFSVPTLLSDQTAYDGVLISLWNLAELTTVARNNDKCLCVLLRIFQSYEWNRWLVLSIIGDLVFCQLDVFLFIIRFWKKNECRDRVYMFSPFNWRLNREGGGLEELCFPDSSLSLVTEHEDEHWCYMLFVILSYDIICWVLIKYLCVLCLIQVMQSMKQIIHCWKEAMNGICLIIVLRCSPRKLLESTLNQRRIFWYGPGILERWISWKLPDVHKWSPKQYPATHAAC